MALQRTLQQRTWRKSWLNYSAIASKITFRTDLIYVVSHTIDCTLGEVKAQLARDQSIARDQGTQLRELQQQTNSLQAMDSAHKFL